MPDCCTVKICGTTSAADARMASNAGADYIGIVVEVPFSERSVTIDVAAEIARQTPIPSVVLVFDRPVTWVQRAAKSIQPFAIQLLGRDSPTEVTAMKQSLPCEVWKSLFLPVYESPDADIEILLGEMEAYIDADADALLFDTVDVSSEKVRFGGTGKISDWNIAAKLINACSVPAFLSGGIRPENVRRAIETVRPYGIDLCSGVESAKGVRDQQKVNRLMQQIRGAVHNS